MHTHLQKCLTSTQLTFFPSHQEEHQQLQRLNKVYSKANVYTWKQKSHNHVGWCKMKFEVKFMISDIKWTLNISDHQKKKKLWQTISILNNNFICYHSSSSTLALLNHPSCLISSRWWLNLQFIEHIGTLILYHLALLCFTDFAFFFFFFFPTS